MKDYDVLVIGGGPAGMAAALGACGGAAREVLLVERDQAPGGILRQCIHRGFGLTYFGEELTGTEYASRFESMVRSSTVTLMMRTSVIELKPNAVAVLSGKESGLVSVRAGAVILASGCRERPAGTQRIAGTRPAGVYTAGTAQRMMNIYGYGIGQRIVLLGSGDVGLIVARQLVQEGREVIAVIEKEPVCGGLPRNRLQCLDAYDIPLMTESTVTEIHGCRRVSGVSVKNLRSGSEKLIACDTLITSLGLIPERELCDGIIRAGALPGWLFICGNACYVHDTVDDVSVEARRAGELAARYASGSPETGAIQIAALSENAYYGSGDICLGCPKSCLVTQAENIWTGMACGRESPVLAG